MNESARALSLRPRTWTRRLLGPFHVTGGFWYCALHLGMRAPEPVVRVLVRCWSSFFAFVSLGYRRVVTRNLDGILGRCGFWERQRRILRTFHEQAWALVERFERMRVQPPPMEIDYSGADWGSLMASDRGLVVVTAHQSNWEAGMLRSLAGAGQRVHVVREAEDSPYIQDSVAAALRRIGGDRVLTHFVGEDPQLGVQMLRALRHGDLVMLAGDRPRAGSRTQRVLLAGRACELPEGPLALARAAGVPILPLFVFRTGRRRYRCVARPLIHVADSDDRRADLQGAAQRLAVEIEWAIREAPHQWSRWEVVWV